MMMFAQSLRWAARSLWAHRFRSALTVLSVMIGSFAIVFISSLAQSGLDTMVQGIEEIGGARLLLLVPRQAEKASALRAAAYPAELTRQDRDGILQGLPHVEEHALFASVGTQDLLADTGRSMRAGLVGGDGAFQRVYQLPSHLGRAISDRDSMQQARVCVVSDAVARALWQESAVGRHLSVAGLRCEVAGVLAPNQRFGVNFGFDWDKLVILPYETLAEALPRARSSTLLLVKTDAPSSNDHVKRVVNLLLLRRHHGIDNFAIVDLGDELSQFYAAFTVMEVVVGGLASFALVIGGIGIMNMMLVSLSERVREIGILRALGARPRHIRSQFLLEAALLSAFGGVAGVAGGMGAALGASALIQHFSGSWLGSVSYVAVTVALLSALAVGVVFGWLPAQRAGTLSPVEAMRR
jgi:putative ABC transport system permease protein